MTAVRYLAALALWAGAAVAQGPGTDGLPGPGAPSPSATPFVATGSTTARASADRAADSLNVLDYKTATDPDDTLSFTRAVARAVALGSPIKLDIPCGNYTISSAVAVTTAANQGLDIHGDGAECVTINQTADADGFDVNLTNYGQGVFSGGAFRISGIKFNLTAAASTVRTAVSISSTATSGQAGPPVLIDDLNFASHTAASYWGIGLYLTEIPNAVYISRINGYQANAGAGTHIQVSGNSPVYTTSLFLRDMFLVGGAKGVVLGDFLQGIHINNLNTVRTAYALYAAPAAGVNVEVQIADSYLNGLTLISPTGTATFGALNMHHTYFDGINSVLSPGATLVTIANVGVLYLSDNIYNGDNSTATTTGLSLTGTVDVPVNVSHQNFSNFVAGGIGLSVNTATYSITFDGLHFTNNTTNIADASSVLHYYVNSTLNNVFFSFGAKGNGMSFPGSTAGANTTLLQATGADANIQVVLNAKGLPSTDWNFRDGISHTILSLKDSQSAGSGLGIGIRGTVTGVSPMIQPDVLTNDFYLGCPNAYATTATGCLPQIPTMAGKPTGVPATTGGASMVYDTTDKWLCIYNPLGTAWNCSAAFTN